MARKYFGSANPMGKILNADHKSDWIVTGVIKDWPENSHFKFDFLGSFYADSLSRSTLWLTNNCLTYFLLKTGTDPLSFQKSMNEALMKKYVEPQMAAVGTAAAPFISTSGAWEYSLQPLTSIHLFSHLEYEIEPNGNISYIYVFSALAIAILLIACVNFINLATARSERRSKEIGIRKTLGSSRPQLIRQFLTESVLMSLFAVVLAIGLVELFLPLFNSIAGESISLNLLRSPLVVPALAALGIVVGVIAGTYPAFFLSSFDPIQVLKGGTKSKKRKVMLRASLVVFQFVVSIVLFIGTFVIFSQLKYIQAKDLGFDKEQVIVIKKANDLGSRLGEFEHELLTNTSVVSVSTSSAIPGSEQNQSMFWLEGSSDQTPRELHEVYCDYNFLNTYGITLADGRFFSLEHPSDSGAVVVNQQAEVAFGAGSLVGRALSRPHLSRSPWSHFPVVGVVKDFNFKSLHQSVTPLVLRIMPPGYDVPYVFVLVRVKPGDCPATIPFIENTWKKYADNETIDYSFLDQDVGRMYDADQETSRIVTMFSILAIFVACLGLLGLAAFVTEQKTKEIGIRKVLGASVMEIIALLSKEFIKWILIANAIAWPLAYYVMNNWLKNFAYRIDMSVWIFAASGLLVMVLALLTVSSHAIKAAAANPVESLRYE
jgi:putative ABC transport system permease protein